MISSLNEVIGQEHLIGLNGPINKMLENNNFYSFILYGPSGSGKTTLANYVARASDKSVFNLNAVKTSKKELEEVLKSYQNSEVVILVDEIHRLDKAKQNLFLPYLENENIILIGTTTENPTYYLNNAFRSRVLLFEYNSVDNDTLFNFIKAYNLKNYSDNILEDYVVKSIVNVSSGDIRKAMKYFKFLVENYKCEELNQNVLNDVLTYTVSFKSDGDEHYDLISAFQKSIRASDVNAAIYYLARLLSVGDHDVLLRRMIVIACEDIGLANSELINKVYNATELFKKVGMPEGGMILSNVVIEMALSNKSTTAYKAINSALSDVEIYPNLEIPKNIVQNQEIGYEYDRVKVFYQNNLPEELKYTTYVDLKTNSLNEKSLKENYDKLLKLKEKNDKR